MKIVVIFVVLTCLFCTGVAVRKHGKGNYGGETPSSEELDHRNYARSNEVRLPSAGGGKTSTAMKVGKKMRSHSCISGDSVNFRCHVIGNSDQVIEFEWWTGNNKLDPRNDGRFAIETRSWGSRLKIAGVYTSDSGKYQCVAKSGKEKVVLSANLSVSFKKPPQVSPKEKGIRLGPKAKCIEYEGSVCANFFNKTKIYVDPDANIEQQERTMMRVASLIDKMRSKFSLSCMDYVMPAYCSLMLPTCHVTPMTGEIMPEMLCGEDCKRVKDEFCDLEHLLETDSVSYHYLKMMMAEVDCSSLPSSADSTCKTLNFPSANEVVSSECYESSDGGDYRGNVAVSESGMKCMMWPRSHRSEEFDAAKVERNFCRNPNGKRERPWCFVDTNYTTIQLCDVPQCRDNYGFYIIVASLSGFVISMILMTIVFLYVRSQNKNVVHTPHKLWRKSSNSRSHFSFPFESLSKSTSEIRVPFLKRPSLELLEQMVGIGKYGLVYRARLNCPLVGRQSSMIAAQPVRDFKELSSLQKDDLWRGLRVKSDLDHINITRLLAIVDDSKFLCPVYEFTEGLNLLQYLQNSRSHSLLEDQHSTFISMALQIANGMTYLESKGYIHRDLAARNVLICEGRTLKIALFELYRDADRSCYYAPSNHTIPIPIRWMAPEAILKKNYSGKSDVWSFGVLLWEIFTYGMLPYGDYKNENILQILFQSQLLPYPNRCSAPIYDLMIRCWDHEAIRRPSFKEISSSLGRLQKDQQQSIARTLPNSSSAFSPPSYTSLASSSHDHSLPSSSACSSVTSSSAGSRTLTLKSSHSYVPAVAASRDDVII